MPLKKFLYTFVFSIVALWGSMAGADASYLYESPLGYSLQCPEKPVGVIPSSVFYQDEVSKGEVLVFANEGYDIHRMDY